VTTAADLITELDDNGVLFGADNGEIWITPRSALNDSLKADLKEHGAALEQVLELQQWQQALDADHQDFMEGGGSEDFGTYFDQWYAREELLRNVLGYEGCIHGSGKACPDVVVRCENCIPKQKKRRYKSL
tara:strand:+ start:90 stop:482 length:393 start_codon:yes stop_codon:yes gene_type:complete